MQTTDSIRRILVVEDDALVRMLTIDLLEELGFAADEAGSASEAMERIRAGMERFQAAILDMGLPDSSGDQLVTEIRSVLSSLPILIASGRSEKEMMDRFGHDSTIAVLGKPYTLANLRKALESIGITSERS